MKIFSVVSKWYPIGVFFIIYHLSFSPAGAQTNVVSSYQLGAGETRLWDTYLSQEKFKGQGFTFLYSSERCKPGRRWNTVWKHEVSRASGDDRAERVSETSTEYTLVFGKRYNWEMNGFRLQAGAVLAFNIGAIQNSANSNNPVQARQSLQLMPSVKLSRDFTLIGQPFTIHEELQLPLVGEMFSPNYGQSYYELFSLGNYDRNIVLTTPFSAPHFRNQLSLDVHVPRFATLRLSYLATVLQSDVNGLKSSVSHQRVMIGFVKEFDISWHRP